MAELKLRNGAIALVDDDLPPIAFQTRWYACVYGAGITYVRGRPPKKFGGHGQTVYLHHFVIGRPDRGFVIDHINGNGLDNRRANLQLTTRSRNCMKARTAVAGGVTRLHGDLGRWRARMRVDGRMVSLGCYDTREAAERRVAIAHDLVWNDPQFNPNGYEPLPPDKQGDGQ